ncbi:MAG: RNA pyrophosphohydrolase [Verrucomicrobiales bacterium]|nr:RNA pyrophosphohydrolase [Verrucomicrobiales bacterium]MCH2026626.1 RNA pyrophosphohydrolase [Verrucomicrobiales bacterium]MEC9035411.1 RNA pyrophosphohydrolase [Verrucomicrobiota bacterium]HAA87260.1 RNA pyrophosphohydrolase [Verrucomicrobiales bacterium]
MPKSSKVSEKQHSGKEYRKNVALILERKSGKVLICQRSDCEESWQFPQGGVDEGEGPIEALHREVREEIGLSSKFYKIIEQREGYRYDFDRRHAKWKHYLGQEQTYFRCRFNGKNKNINLGANKPEFTNYCWIYPDEFNLDWVADFKRQVYLEVFRDFFDLKIT